MINPCFTITMIVFPVIMPCLISYRQLEYCSFSGILRIGIFNIRAQANNHSVDEMVGFACPVGTVVLIMLMQFHTEIAIFFLL